MSHEDQVGPQTLHTRHIDTLVAETERLQRDMRRFGVSMESGPAWQLDLQGERWYLKEEWIARGRKLVSDARYAWWKKWLDLTLPIGAFIIALIALIVSILSLSR